jgi:hypothetical protein
MQLTTKAFPNAALMALAFAHAALAQIPVSIDWSSSPPTPVGAPSQINGKVTLSVVVTNVNDVLYQYTVNTSVTTAPTNDLANLLSLVTAPVKIAGDDPCSGFKTGLASLEKAIHDDKSLKPTLSGSSYASVALKDSIAAWNKIGPLKTLTDLENNSPANCKNQDLHDWIAGVDARVNSSVHKTAPQTCVLQPGQQCTITVNEYYTPPAALGSTPATQVTTASGQTFTITPSSSVLTLSAGFMGTTLAARTYTSTNVPGQTSPVLVVNNNSRIRPGAVALLNYAIPHADGYSAGLALSAGPVITFGSASANISTLGFFTGISAHLWHRLYITPGFHFGQFADFPAGFAPGTAVPTSIATPTAVNRWTGRFAFAITFQTPDFSKLSGSSATTSTTATPNPAGQTKPAPASGK